MAVNPWTVALVIAMEQGTLELRVSKVKLF